MRSIDGVLWRLLAVSVITEITGDLLLKWWAETNRWLIFTAGVLAYIVATGMFAMMLRRGEMAIIFALWVGTATVGVTLAGWWLFNEALTWRQITGITLTVGAIILLGGK